MPEHDLIHFNSHKLSTRIISKGRVHDAYVDTCVWALEQALAA